MSDWYSIESYGEGLEIMDLQYLFFRLMGTFFVIFTFIVIIGNQFYYQRGSTNCQCIALFGKLKVGWGVYF